MKRLKDLNKPFKYIVTAVIMQKNGAGLHTATSTFWDITTDGSATVRWESKTMYCITTVRRRAARNRHSATPRNRLPFFTACAVGRSSDWRSDAVSPFLVARCEHSCSVAIRHRGSGGQQQG